MLWHSLEKHVADFFAAHPGPLLLAVSGGLDSSCLLAVCRKVLRPDRLAVAHFNHRTRGAESDADEAFVRAKAEGLKLYVGHAGAPLVGEDSMREARWRFLRGCGDYQVVTAHHLDDQLETFLMRLLRGAGLEGLGAMAPAENKILRPFLDRPRQMLVDYGAEFREDTSNSDDKYFRNRVRRHLVPELHRLADEKWLARFGGTLEELRATARELKPRLALVETPFWSRLSAAEWEGWSPEYRARALREIMKSLGAATPDRKRITEFLARENGEISGGVTMTRSCGQLYFQTPAQRARRPVFAELFEIATRGEMNGLEARFFQPGDRFGGVKLKRLLLERRIPKPERALLPVLAHPGTSEVRWFFPMQTPSVTVVAGRVPFSL